MVIDNDSKKFFQVGVQLPPQEKQELIEFLQKNVDVFAWNAYEALGIDPDFICHHLIPKDDDQDVRITNR